MKYIIRPKKGYLALAETVPGVGGGLGKLLSFALPDTEFWLWLAVTGTKDKMELENPDRMARVLGDVGVGVFPDESPIITRAGHTKDSVVSAEGVMWVSELEEM